MKKDLYYHVLFWIAYMGIFTFVEGGYTNDFRQALYLELVLLPGRFIAVYTNYFVFIPKLLIKGRLVRYFVFSILTVFIGALVQRMMMFWFGFDLIFPAYVPGNFWQFHKILRDSVLITSPMIFIIGTSVVARWIASEKRAEVLKSEKLRAELSYLRSQINPHFFFNTLNTLYGLAIKKSDKTAEVVMKLSELMSYILYETDKPQVLLTTEIEQVKRYIALEKVRYGDRFNVDFQMEANCDKISIPPLILLPFVENAFKHGIHQKVEKGWINILVRCDKGELLYSVENSLGKTSPAGSKGGLGIENLRKRLELLHPGKYRLLCREEDNFFKSLLSITIQ